MTPYWEILTLSPLLIIKLGLVIVLTVLIAILSIAGRKAKEDDYEKHMKVIGIFGKVSLLVAVIIVILAVYIFR